MGMTKTKKHFGGRWILLTLIVLLAALCFFTALRNLQGGQGEVGRQQLETALRRAAVACYAAEGVYPPDLDYLTAHSGVQIDETHYIVFYEIFADNLMPDITVLVKNA